MGDANQLLFIEQHAARFRGPFLEVGSKDYGTTQDIRSVLAEAGRYVGVDLEEGPGVDVVLDLTGPFEQVDAALGGERFGTIFCLSVLEHCRQPFAMAENLARLLARGGKVCLSVPLAWKFHGFPSDYWRFTHEGVKLLFADLSFDPHDCAAATARRGEFFPVDRQAGRVNLATKSHWKKGRFLRGFVAGVLKWLTGYPYVLAPTNLLMIGTREE